MTKKRRMWMVRSRFEEDAKLDRSWVQWDDRTNRCSRCSGGSPEWNRSPTPIDVYVTALTDFAMQDVHALVDYEVQRPPFLPQVHNLRSYNTNTCILRRELHDELYPHAKGMLVGNVFNVSSGFPVACANHVTWTPHPDALVYSTRGPDGHYGVCEGCGRIMWMYGGDMAIPEYALDQHLVYQDDRGFFLFDDILFKSGLKERFPELYRHGVRVIPKPEHPEVLPGDPGWDGHFRQRFVSLDACCAESDRLLKLKEQKKDEWQKKKRGLL